MLASVLEWLSAEAAQILVSLGDYSIRSERELITMDNRENGNNPEKASQCISTPHPGSELPSC
jgi:hypothetical protein